MMRKLLVLGVLATVSACSSGGTGPIFSAIKDVVLPGKEEAAPTGSATVLTRDRIKASGLAAVRARIEGEEVANVLTATSLNGSYVTYVSAFRQSVTMNGSLVTATRGLGGDLLAVRSDANDPVVVVTPPKDWPTHLTRDYRFPGIGPEGDITHVSCDMVRGGAAKLTIVELVYDVIKFTENCSGNGVAFSNTYFAEAKSGQIWQTRQWIGDKRGYLNIEVLEPFTLD